MRPNLRARDRKFWKRNLPFCHIVYYNQDTKPVCVCIGRPFNRSASSKGKDRPTRGGEGVANIAETDDAPLLPVLLRLPGDVIGLGGMGLLSGVTDE